MCDTVVHLKKRMAF